MSRGRRREVDLTVNDFNVCGLRANLDGELCPNIDDVGISSLDHKPRAGGGTFARRRSSSTQTDQSDSISRPHNSDLAVKRA